MEYTISQGMHGWLVREAGFGREHQMPKVWCYTTLKEALDGLNMLFNPPQIIPADMQVLGKLK